MHTAHCPHCLARIPSPPAKLARYGVLTVAWLVVLAMAFAAAVIGPFILVVMPFFALGCIGLLAGAYDYAHGDRTCARCGRAYEIDGVAVVPRPGARPVPAAPIAAT